MKNYSRNREFRGRQFDSRPFDNRPRQMFKVVCSNCGKDCEVPFKPTSNKPVYCSDCFEKLGNKENKRSFDNRDNQSSSQLEMVNAKLDKIISLLQSSK